MNYLNDISKNCVGKVCKSLNSGDFKVLRYNDSKNVEIQFLTTGYRKVAEMKEVKTGSIKDPYSPSIYGVGILGTKYPSTINGVNTKEYALWGHMLERCYSDIYKKKYPTYEGCKVSNNFKSFEYFYEWCHRQVGFGNKDWHLDKDLLVKGDKVYSENTCIFLPQEINKVLTKREVSRGKYLIGVSWYNTKKVFVARINKNKGKQEYLGRFKTEIEAYNAYKVAKENYLKELADKWKGQIDTKAYEALMNYKVDITD